VTERKTIESGGPRKVSSTFNVDSELLADASEVAQRIRRNTGRKVTQSEMVEEGLRLWMASKGDPRYVDASEREGQLGKTTVEYPARFKPVIDELLTILYGEPEGKYQAMMQRLMQEVLRDMPQEG
jgi:hypothetical protein